jgi:hypothetical protein
MSFAAKNAVQAFPGDRLRPGDVVLFNSPFLGSGHFPDFFMIQPAFTDAGQLIGFVANILHHTDVGGMRPGSQAVEGVFDYFQEGLRPAGWPWKRAGKRTSPPLSGEHAHGGPDATSAPSGTPGELRIVELERCTATDVPGGDGQIMDRTEAGTATSDDPSLPSRTTWTTGTRRADAPGGDGHRADDDI